MRIRFESSSYKGAVGKSGVGYYSGRFASALKLSNEVEEVNGPFVEFSLGNKVYRKLSSYNLAPAFDYLKQPTDLTIFPNFDCWRSVNSHLTAVTIHDLTYLYYPELVEGRNLAHLRRVVPRALKRADIVLTVSETVKRELTKEFSLPEEKCIITPVPPDEKFSIPTAMSVDELLEKFSIPTSKYIYFIGNLDPRKNLTTLVSSYSSLPGGIKNEYSLVIAGGSGWKSKRTQHSINEAKAKGENILQVGYIDDSDTVPLMQYASLLAVPSIYEGFGMPIAEAFACKTPVVASDIPVFRETARDAAIFATPSDCAGFADAIKAVLTSKKMQSKLINKGESRLGDFSWQKNAISLTEKASSLL